MDWTDEGLLLAARPHGESAAIAEVLTAAHGRHLGVVRGGAGRRLAPVLQPGAQLHLTWRARLDAHLGALSVEPLRARAAAVLADPDRLAGLSALCALAAWALPEREPQPRLYPLTVALADAIADGADWFGPYQRWARALLEETGFGLDLTACAMTGATEGLAHVCPCPRRCWPTSRPIAAKWRRACAPPGTSWPRSSARRWATARCPPPARAWPCALRAEAHRPCAGRHL